MKRGDQGVATKKDLEATKQELLKRIAKLPTKNDLRNFATKDDLKNFPTKEDAKNFATKDDLKNFATKDDLKNFPTKEDAKNFATKDDLKNFATKDDLKNFATNDALEKVTREIVNIRQEMATKAELNEVKETVQQILVIVDGMAKKLDDSRTEKAAIEHTFLRHENRLDDHETRIKALEEKEAL
jgi:hypothetical protein